jgi:hypothetical protein
MTDFCPKLGDLVRAWLFPCMIAVCEYSLVDDGFVSRHDTVSPCTCGVASKITFILHCTNKNKIQLIEIGYMLRTRPRP